MRKTWIVLFVLFLSPAFASAQDRPSWEIFGGYQYTYSDYGVIQDAANAMGNVLGQSLSADHNLTMTGANATFQKNIGKRWAAALDIGGMSGTKEVDLSQFFQLLGYIPGGSTQTSIFTPTVYTVMVGPQYNMWKFRGLQIFVRGMGGASRSALTMDDTTKKALTFLAPKYRTTTTDPAVMAGAGAQYPVYRHIFIRASADYIHPFSTATQNYLRISAGIGIDKIAKLF
ncbi:MAG: outer membrane beta-barrel protein [Terriglobales bacterium]